MTRIIGGFAGSLPLAVPRSGVRPTSDRVREAMFSALDARQALSGAAVLDLYTGSGALGLEAASRGATEVVLVEKTRAVAEVCRRNADTVRRAALGTPPQISVVVRGVASYLETAIGAFDIVFIDPPYELSEQALGNELNLLIRLLSTDAVVVIERSSRSPEPRWPAQMSLRQRRDYGDTTLWFASIQPAPPSQFE